MSSTIPVYQQALPLSSKGFLCILNEPLMALVLEFIGADEIALGEIHGVSKWIYMIVRFISLFQSPLVYGDHNDHLYFLNTAIAFRQLPHFINIRQYIRGNARIRKTRATGEATVGKGSTSLPFLCENRLASNVHNILPFCRLCKHYLCGDSLLDQVFPVNDEVFKSCFKPALRHDWRFDPCGSLPSACMNFVDLTNGNDGANCNSNMNAATEIPLLFVEIFRMECADTFGEFEFEKTSFTVCSPHCFQHILAGLRTPWERHRPWAIKVSQQVFNTEMGEFLLNSDLYVRAGLSVKISAGSNKVCDGISFEPDMLVLSKITSELVNIPDLHLRFYELIDFSTWNNGTSVLSFRDPRIINKMLRLQKNLIKLRNKVLFPLPFSVLQHHNVKGDILPPTVRPRLERTYNITKDMWNQMSGKLSGAFPLQALHPICPLYPIFPVSENVVKQQVLVQYYVRHGNEWSFETTFERDYSSVVFSDNDDQIDWFRKIFLNALGSAYCDIGPMFCQSVISGSYQMLGQNECYIWPEVIFDPWMEN